MVVKRAREDRMTPATHLVWSQQILLPQSNWHLLREKHQQSLFWNSSNRCDCWWPELLWIESGTKEKHPWKAGDRSEEVYTDPPHFQEAGYQWGRMEERYSSSQAALQQPIPVGCRQIKAKRIHSRAKLCVIKWMPTTLGKKNAPYSKINNNSLKEIAY